MKNERMQEMTLCRNPKTDRLVKTKKQPDFYSIRIPAALVTNLQVLPFSFPS